MVVGPWAALDLAMGVAGPLVALDLAAAAAGREVEMTASQRHRKS